jgi:flagellar motility protein MotE (MotC chaperone)
MRVRDWQDILDDVVESDNDPDQWRAVGGDRRNGIGEDLYLAHPSTGVFHLKTYAKNPYEVQGVGSRVARKVDDEIDPLFPQEGSGLFGVQQPVEDESEAEEKAKTLEQVVKAHADAPTTPQDFFEDVMDTLDSPAYGPMDFELDDRPETMAELTDTFEEAEELLDAELEDLIDENVSRGFH